MKKLYFFIAAIIIAMATSSLKAQDISITIKQPRSEQGYSAPAVAYSTYDAVEIYFDIPFKKVTIEVHNEYGETVLLQTEQQTTTHTPVIICTDEMEAGTYTIETTCGEYVLQGEFTVEN